MDGHSREKINHVLDNFLQRFQVRFWEIVLYLGNYNIPMEAIDAYIQTFPPEVQQVLDQVRATIRENAPDAIEIFSYGMPGYQLNKKPLVYFAGYKKHIGLYATPSGHQAFEQELSPYKQGKGSVQFPLDAPMPLELIARMVAFRVQENKRK